MSEHFAPAIIEGARIFANLERDRIRAARPGSSQSSIIPSSNEEYLPNVKLNNFVNREIVEDTHVLVVEHKEHLEKLAVPPTEEEIAQARADRKFLTKIWAGVASVAIVVAGVVVIVETKRKTVVVPTSEKLA